MPHRRRPLERTPPPRLPREDPLADHVYKHIELTGSSAEGIEPAIRNAIHRAGDTVRNMRWFEVVDVRGHVESKDVVHWQVTIKVGFTLDG